MGGRRLADSPKAARSPACAHSTSDSSSALSYSNSSGSGSISAKLKAAIMTRILLVKARFTDASLAVVLVICGVRLGADEQGTADFPGGGDGRPGTSETGDTREPIATRPRASLNRRFVFS